MFCSLVHSPDVAMAGALSLRWVQGPKDLDYLPWSSNLYWQGAGMEMEQQGLELSFI